MKNQFAEANNQTPEYIDWIEHEVFNAVISEYLNDTPLNSQQTEFLYKLFLSANLAQLCLSLLNSNRRLFHVGDLNLKQGIALQRMGELQQAELAFNNASSELPDSGLPQYHLGYCKLYSGNADEALELFQLSVQKSPDFAPGWQSLAGCHYQESRFEEALSACDKAYQLDPSITSCYITAISSHLALEQTEEALTWLHQASLNNIKSRELLRLAGITALQNNNPTQAIEQLSLYLQHHPEDIEVVSIRARAYADAEKWQELIDELLNLLNTDPHNAWCLEHLFLAYFHTKHWAKAESMMNMLKQQSEYYSKKHQDKFALVIHHQSIVLTKAD